MRGWSPFLAAAAFSVGFCVIAGAISHATIAQFVPDLYSVAIGDGLLPTAPIDQPILSPMIIGATCTWWLGLAAAPIVFTISGGVRADWRTRNVLRALAMAGGVALAGLAIGTAIDGGFSAASALASLLDFGYVALALGLAAGAITIRRSRLSGLLLISRPLLR